MSNKEDNIRKIAHQLWESEGRPEGRAHQHWERAVTLAEKDMSADQLSVKDSIKQAGKINQPDQT